MGIICLQISNLFGLCQIYFTPRDDIKSQLIELIKQEKKSIEAAVYMFTEKVMAQALVDAHVRGVKVVLILDQISMGDRFGKGSFLQNNGIPVLVYKTDSFNMFSTPIMHHKFFIFGHNGIVGKSLVWTGSFNCTASASKQNYENVIVSDDAGMVQSYRQCFHDLVSQLSPSKNFDQELVAI